MKPVMRNGVDTNVDVTWSPRLKEHLFYHPIGMADPHDEAGEIALDSFTWVGDAMMQSAPYSRVVSAGALTAGVTGGAAASVLLHGRDFDGKKLSEESVPKFFRPVYQKLDDWGVIGKLDHNPSSSDLASRSKRFTIRYAIPAAVGGTAVWLASKTYFDHRKDREDIKNPNYLEDFSLATASRQAKPWGVLSAVTSLFASASGASFLPFNYGVAVNTQSYMESGHRVMMPGIGKVVSNNRSTLSYGTGELEHFLAHYTANNPSIHPERLEQLWAALVRPHFPEVTQQQIQNLVDETHALRDPYMKRMLDGENPQKVRAEMDVFFTKQFSKEGLWSMLMKAGIDPATANIKNNGLAGSIGNTLGAKHDVERLQSEYVHKAEAWKAAHPEMTKAQDVHRHTSDLDVSAAQKPSPVISQVQHKARQVSPDHAAGIALSS